MPADMGEILYKYGIADEDGKSGERKKLWRSPASVFMLAVCAFLVFWFLYSFISALIDGGAEASVFIPSFFALAVCVAIVLLTVLKIWAKLARFALDRGLVRQRERARVEADAEMMEEVYEQSEKTEPFIEIYRDYIRATDWEEVKIFAREGVERITAVEGFESYSLLIQAGGEGYDFDAVILHGLKLPKSEIKKLKKIFGDKLEIEPLYDGESREAEKKLDFTDVNAAGIVVGIIVAAAGGGVIALHYCLSASIPVALGTFIIAGGALVFCSGFSAFPVVNDFFVPLIAGATFAIIPLQFCKIIAEGMGINIVFSSVHEFLRSFNPLFCAVGFLTAIGALLIAIAFWNLIKLIRNK